MSLLCLAHHAVRLWRSPRRWPRGATNPVQIRWKSYVSFPLSWGIAHSFTSQNALPSSNGHSHTSLQEAPALKSPPLPPHIALLKVFLVLQLQLSPPTPYTYAKSATAAVDAVCVCVAVQGRGSRLAVFVCPIFKKNVVKSTTE